MATTTHIKFGDGLDVTDEGAGVIRVDGQGAQGPQGPAGATGPQGPAGTSGVIPGGTRGQVLTKQSSTDGDSVWSPRITFPPDGVGGDIVLGGDTNLYNAGGILKTDNVFWSVGNIVAKQGAAQQVFIGDLGDSVPSIAFGADTEVSFRRYGTDLAFLGTKLQFGNAGDSNMYRPGSGQLKTDSDFYTKASIVIGVDDTNRKLYFGSALDTTLYRVAAGQLGATFGALGNKTIEYGAPDSGGTGYRVLRITN